MKLKEGMGNRQFAKLCYVSRTGTPCSNSVKPHMYVPIKEQSKSHLKTLKQAKKPKTQDWDSQVQVISAASAILAKLHQFSFLLKSGPLNVSTIPWVLFSLTGFRKIGFFLLLLLKLPSHCQASIFEFSEKGAAEMIHFSKQSYPSITACGGQKKKKK